MNRAERRRQQKASEKARLNAPYNFSNFKSGANIKSNRGKG